MKQLKQSRPLIKEADKSVLNPGIKPKTLPVNTVTTPRTPGKGKPVIQQVKPEEIRKPAGPEGGRGAIEERKRLKPEEREVQPEEKRKPVVPEGGPTGRGEKQRVKPDESVKPTPAAPVVSPTDRGEKQRVKPDERSLLHQKAVQPAEVKNSKLSRLRKGNPGYLNAAPDRRTR